MKPETKLKHAHTFYNALLEDSDLIIEGDDTARIFKGSLTNVFTVKCRLPLSYYSNVRTTLENFDCLKVIERGTRGYDSVVRLLKAPPAVPPESFVKSSEKPLTDRREVATLRADVDKLKAWRESQKGLDVLQAQSNIEERLLAIENRLNKIDNN